MFLLATMPKKPFTNYIDSPLGVLLSKALEKLSAIKIKYAADLAKAEAPDVLDALNIANLIEESFKLLHCTILPKFKNGKTPGLFSLGKMVSGAISLRPHMQALETRERRLLEIVIVKLFSPRLGLDGLNSEEARQAIIDFLEHEKQQLFKSALKIPGPDLEFLFTNIKEKISALNVSDITANELQQSISNHLMIDALVPKHPMVYEMLEVVADLGRDRKESLEQLLPFLDPKAPVNALQSGIIGTLLANFGSFLVDHLEDHSSSFAYRVTARHLSIIFDGEIVYREIKQKLHQTLEPALRRYLAEHEQDCQDELARDAIIKGQTRVMSDIARSKLLQRLKTILSDALRDNIQTFSDEFKSPNDMRGQSVLRLILQKINLTQQLLHAATLFKRALQEKEVLFATTPITELLKTIADPALLEEVNQHQQNGLDVSYLRAPLPNNESTYIEGKLATPGPVHSIRTHLNRMIHAQLEELESRENVAKQEFSSLNELALANWQEECQIYLQTIGYFQHQLDNSAYFVDLKVNNIEHLELALARLSILTKQREDWRQKIIHLMQSAQEVLSLSHESLRVALEKTFSSVVIAVNAFDKSILLAQQATDKDQLTITTRLQKLKSDASFAQNLRSADPRKMQILLNETTDKSTSLRNQHVLLINEIDTLQASISQQHQVETDLAAQEKTMLDKRAQLEADSRALHDVRAAFAESMATRTPETAQNNQTLLELLCSINSVLATDQTSGKIPFKLIERLLAPQNITFVQFLNFLNANLSVEDWQKYHHRQENLLTRRPSIDEFHRMHDLLSEAVQGKISALDRQLTLHQESERLKQLLQQNDDIKIQLDEELQVIQSRRQSATLERNALEEKHRDVSAALPNLAADQEQQRYIAKVLQQFLEIITEISEFNRQIELFVENDDVSDFVEQSLALENKLTSLMEKVDLVADLFNSLKEREAYQDTYACIQQLVNQIRQRITSTVAEKSARQASIVTFSDPLDIGSTEEKINEEEERTLDLLEHRRSMVERFTEELTRYLKNRQNQYAWKDFFTSKDKAARTQFIAILNRQFSDYLETGTPANVLQSLQNGISEFPGTKLRPLLNKMMADILAFEQDELPEPREEASAVKESLAITNPQYVALLDDLYQNISGMRCYGETRQDETGKVMIDLAEQLKQEVDYFVIKHGKKLPNLEEYQVFTKKFNARLHSADDVVNKQDSYCSQLIINIALIMFLIPKLLYSKVTSGRFSFFLEGNQATHLISTIEESVQALSVPGVVA